MKNSFIKKLALAMTAVMVVGSLSACGSNEDASAGGESSGNLTENSSDADPSSNDTNSAQTTDDGETLVVGSAPFSSKFSTFIG